MGGLRCGRRRGNRRRLGCRLRFKRTLRLRLRFRHRLSLRVRITLALTLRLTLRLLWSSPSPDLQAVRSSTEHPVQLPLWASQSLGWAGVSFEFRGICRIKLSLTVSLTGSIAIVARLSIEVMGRTRVWIRDRARKRGQVRGKWLRIRLGCH